MKPDVYIKYRRVDERIINLTALFKKTRFQDSIEQSVFEDILVRWLAIHRLSITSDTKLGMLLSYMKQSCDYNTDRKVLLRSVANNPQRYNKVALVLNEYINTIRSEFKNLEPLRGFDDYVFKLFVYNSRNLGKVAALRVRERHGCKSRSSVLK